MNYCEVFTMVSSNIHCQYWNYSQIFNDIFVHFSQSLFLCNLHNNKIYYNYCVIICENITKIIFVNIAQTFHSIGID